MSTADIEYAQQVARRNTAIWGFILGLLILLAGLGLGALHILKYPYQPVVTGPGDLNVTTVVIGGCEYLKAERGEPDLRHPLFSLTHKGNCTNTIHQ